MRSRDRTTVIDIWHRGWHDAHSGIVPEGLLAFRTIPFFEIWFEQSTDQFYVAVRENKLAGFVSICGPELVKLYVNEADRGTEAARALLAFAQEKLAHLGAKKGVLFCTAGNARAKRFYEREGWNLAETLSDRLWLPEYEQASFAVDTHRFEKDLT